ncbi:MAG: hypothetical protein AB8B67_00460 [Rickettsiaceae bacterium]
MYLLRINIITSFMCILAICWLFYLKENVTNINYQIEQVKNQISVEQEKINNLKTEFIYLTMPNRLRKIASNSLGLQTAQIKQLINDPMIPNRQKEIALTNKKSYNTNHRKAKWRYKNNSLYTKKPGSTVSVSGVR